MNNLGACANSFLFPLFLIFIGWIIIFINWSDNSTFGYDMGWWKEEHFNASDADGDGLLNITEFNE